MFSLPLRFPHPFISWIQHWKFCYATRKSKQVEEKPFQNLQCAGVHPALSCYQNMHSAAQDMHESHQEQIFSACEP